MKFKRVWPVGLLLLLLTQPAVAAGSLVTTRTNPIPNVFKYTIVWTSDASGDVSGNTLTIYQGHILQAQFIPGTGALAPDALYDVVLNDTSTVDVLVGTGANLSATVSKVPLFLPPYYYDGTFALDLVVSAAGAANSGTVILWVGP